MKWQQDLPSYKINRDDANPQLLITHLKSWNTIQVTGDERKSYLQGQLTCDVVSLAPSETTLGSHCDAKGKVWSIFRLFHHNDGYALFQHASAIDKALIELKKYSVFSKVDISIGQDVALGIMGNDAEQFVNSLSTDLNEVREIAGGTAIKIEQQRWLLILSQEAASNLIDAQPEESLCHENLWDKFDIEAAIPRITSENQNTHIPQAFNLQALFGINFSKGCYTGQETVARAKYRGTNKRSMYIVKSNSVDLLDKNSSLERSVGENWRSVGPFITYYQFANQECIALIILPNNLDSETTLRQADQPSVQWEIVQLPYSLDE